VGGGFKRKSLFFSSTGKNVVRVSQSISYYMERLKIEVVKGFTLYFECPMQMLEYRNIKLVGGVKSLTGDSMIGCITFNTMHENRNGHINIAISVFGVTCRRTDCFLVEM